MDESPSVIANIEGERIELDIERAEKLVQSLQQQINAARKNRVGYIELENGRLSAEHLREYFARLYPDDERRIVFWTGKLFRKLLREWVWGRMKLIVWCKYCDKDVSPDSICNTAVNYHRQYWHYEPCSISAESILKEQQKFAIHHGEGTKMVMHFRLLVDCLTIALEHPEQGAKT